jgi:hypothetical protein
LRLQPQLVGLLWAYLSVGLGWLWAGAGWVWLRERRTHPGTT